MGFAAETHDLGPGRRPSSAAKGVDLMVANDVSAPGVGFDHDTNAVTILGPTVSRREVALTSKREVADAVFDTCDPARLGGPGGPGGGTPA